MNCPKSWELLLDNAGRKIIKSTQNTLIVANVGFVPA